MTKTITVHKEFWKQAQEIGNMFQKPEIIQSPMYGIVADIVKNNKNLTKDLQNAIARFIEFEATPRSNTSVTTAASPDPETNTKPGRNALES